MSRWSWSRRGRPRRSALVEPQADEEGNPISVRVTYQIEGEGDETYWLYGAEAGIDLSERSRAGVRVVRSDGREGSDERFAIDAGFVEHHLVHFA